MARRRQHVEFTYTPAAVASENKQLMTLNPGEVIKDFVARVTTAGDGTGTVSFGTASAGTELASTANIGAAVAGYKFGAAAQVVGAATALGVWANYVVGTATVKPIIRISFTVCETGI